MAIINDFFEKDSILLRNKFAIFISLLNVLVVIIGIFFIILAGKTFSDEEMPRPQFVVNGEGKVFVKPDIASFTATVVNDALRVGDAQNQNAVRSNAVVSFLKQNGLQDKDIKTVNYFLQPQYQHDRGPCPLITDLSIPCSQVNNPPRVVSYQVRSSLEVKVRDLNKIDDLLQGVVSAGANEVGSINFMVENEKAAIAEARKLAIDDAQAKAHILARDLGVRLKKIISFSESGGVPIYYGKAFLETASIGGSAPAPQVEPGGQEIRSTVTITYEFK